MINLNKLKAKRVEVGLTQVEIAELLGINFVTYQRKETGIRDFSIKEVIKLTDILKLTIEDVNEIFFNNKLTNRLINKTEIA